MALQNDLVTCGETLGASVSSGRLLSPKRHDASAPINGCVDCQRLGICLQRPQIQRLRVGNTREWLAHQLLVPAIWSSITRRRSSFSPQTAAFSRWRWRRMLTAPLPTPRVPRTAWGGTADARPCDHFFPFCFFLERAKRVRGIGEKLGWWRTHRQTH